jgi:hypothetical protein
VDVHGVIQSHRRRLVEAMQQFTRVKSDLDGTEVAVALVVDAEIYRLDAMVRWLDTADARLGRLQGSVTAPPASGVGTSAARRPSVTPEAVRRKAAR